MVEIERDLLTVFKGGNRLRVYTEHQGIQKALLNNGYVQSTDGSLSKDLTHCVYEAEVQLVCDIERRNFEVQI